MKLYCSALLLSTLHVAVLAVYTPVRVRYDSLLSDDASKNPEFLQALQEVGMVSITNISPLFQDQKQELLLTALPECVLTTHTNFPVTTFPDGTTRHTIATHSLEGVPEALLFEEHPACAQFQTRNLEFRQTIETVVTDFTKYLSKLLQLDEIVLLQDSATSKDGSSGFTLKDIVHHGDHLEHFHVYQKNSTTTSDDETTLDWHVDQGLLLAFTPGVDVSSKQTTGGFYIQFPDGTSDMVQFDVEQDELVFFLGDGMAQILASPETQLRALPHALKLEASTQQQQSRVWYGRMVLAPSTAIHPASQQTFGAIRTAMIAGDNLSLGCSSDHQIARVLVGDDVTAESCVNETQSFCWHRCMNHTDYSASPDSCESQNLDFACASTDEQILWNGNIHNSIYEIQCGSDFQNASTDDSGETGAGNGHDHTDDDAQHNGDDDSSASTVSMMGIAFGAVSSMMMMML